MGMPPSKECGGVVWLDDQQRLFIMIIRNDRNDRNESQPMNAIRRFTGSSHVRTFFRVFG